MWLVRDPVVNGSGDIVVRICTEYVWICTYFKKREVHKYIWVSEANGGNTAFRLDVQRLIEGCKCYERGNKRYVREGGAKDNNMRGGVQGRRTKKATK